MTWIKRCAAALCLASLAAAAQQQVKLM